ncbi:MAG TPA: hypothetical protein VF618_26670 [Thermoanaerobaculia bacterium]
MDSNDPKARFYARTMHTPDDAERAAQRAALRDLSKALLPLHRALIDTAKVRYGNEVGHISSPGHLLTLLQEDPFFSWLKPLTSLIVDIDEMVRQDFGRPELDDITGRANRLFGTQVDAAFAAHYVPVLQQDVDVAIYHVAVRKAIARLS